MRIEAWLQRLVSPPSSSVVSCLPLRQMLILARSRYQPFSRPLIHSRTLRPTRTLHLIPLRSRTLHPRLTPSPPGSRMLLDGGMTWATAALCIARCARLAAVPTALMPVATWSPVGMVLTVRGNITAPRVHRREAGFRWGVPGTTWIRKPASCVRVGRRSVTPGTSWMPWGPWRLAG